MQDLSACNELGLSTRGISTDQGASGTTGQPKVATNKDKQHK